MCESRYAIGAVTGLLFAALLGGCAGARIHDAARAEQAAAVKQDYADAKVSEAAEADRKNLELLLAQELQVVRESYALQVDFATLALANDGTPAARTLLEARRRMSELGFDTTSSLRDSLSGDRVRAAARRTLDSFAKVFRDAGMSPPDCAAMPIRRDLPAGMPQAKKDRVLALIPRYEAECAELVRQELPPGGQLRAAYEEWQAARRAVEERRRKRESAEQDLANAAAAHAAQARDLAAANVAGPELTARLQAHARRLAELLAKVKQDEPGAESELSIEALVDLLSAAAGDEVDPDDPDVSRAALVAAQFPALAGDLAALRARRGAPSVSGLLIALRQQTLLADAARQRVALAEERVAILKARYDGYYAEAQRWLRFVDAVCSHAVLSQRDAKHPGVQCNGFSADDSGACTMQGRAIAPCVLAEPWRDRLRANAPAPARRELYKGTAAYLQALALQALPQEQALREIDVRHRETLLAKRTALAAWDNLVGVPIDQLDGFYKTGFKPAEIADLIVKALGFTAIAVGVAN